MSDMSHVSNETQLMSESVRPKPSLAARYPIIAEYRLNFFCVWMMDDEFKTCTKLDETHSGRGGRAGADMRTRLASNTLLCHRQRRYGHHTGLKYLAQVHHHDIMTFIIVVVE